MDELTLADYFAILRRWKKLFLSVSLGLLIVTMMVALNWANYRSTAIVQIEQSDISATATTPSGMNPRDAMEALADQRVSEIEQKVTSTASLIEIITKFDLYPAMRRHKPIAAVAEKMLRKIKVELVSGEMANPQAAGKVSTEDLSAIAFKLSFDYSDPLITQQVTDELATRFLDQDLKDRRTQTQETSAFLDAQIAALETSMADQEKKIADYQKEHGASRPETLAFNQQALAQVSMNMQNLDSQITSNEGNIGSLRAQLATMDPYSRVIADGQVMTTPSVQLKALQAQYASLTAQYGPEHPDVVRVRHQIEALQAQVGTTNRDKDSAQLKAQILDVRTNLAAAEKTYGPEHPDVVSLQNQLQRLEDQLATHHARPGTNNNGVIADADNPAYLQIAAELQAAEEQHKALLAQRQQVQEQQDSYQKAIIENPEAEQEMAALSRDYDNAQLRYRELKEKKMSADMDQQMQKDREGQRLTLIDPPELPLDTHPSKMVMILGGILLSLLGGAASVVAAQALSQCIVGPQHMERLTGVAPLVAIPHIYTNEEHENSLQHRSFVLWNIFTRRLGLS